MMNYRIQPYSTESVGDFGRWQNNIETNAKDRSVIQKPTAKNLQNGKIAGTQKASVNYSSSSRHSTPAAGRHHTACLLGINPQGVRVASFKAPTKEELDHDYLWRIHKVVPAKGDRRLQPVTLRRCARRARSGDIVPEAVWRPRFGADQPV